MFYTKNGLAWCLSSSLESLPARVAAPCKTIPMRCPCAHSITCGTERCVVPISPTSINTTISMQYTFQFLHPGSVHFIIVFGLTHPLMNHDPPPPPPPPPLNTLCRRTMVVFNQRRRTDLRRSCVVQSVLRICQQPMKALCLLVCTNRCTQCLVRLLFENFRHIQVSAGKI